MENTFTATMIENRKKIASQYGITKKQVEAIIGVVNSPIFFGRPYIPRFDFSRIEVEALVGCGFVEKIEGGYTATELGESLYPYISGGELVYNN